MQHWDTDTTLGDIVDIQDVIGKLDIGSRLHFKPGTLDVVALIDGVNSIFKGAVYLDLERNSEGILVVNSKGWIKGLCPNPEHNDHTPSFGIHIKTGACHCMKCGTWKFGELLQILDAFYNDVDERIFPTDDAVIAFMHQYAYESDPTDPLERLKQGCTVTRSNVAFGMDITRADLGMAEWAYRARHHNPEYVEQALQEFDRLYITEGKDEQAYIYYRRVLMEEYQG